MVFTNDSYSALHCSIWTFSGNCDLEEINVVIINHPNPNDIDLEITDINGVYKKQDYKINGKPWYKHIEEASKNVTFQTSRMI